LAANVANFAKHFENDSISADFFEFVSSASNDTSCFRSFPWAKDGQ
jgi:hypothetical protein